MVMLSPAPLKAPAPGIPKAVGGNEGDRLSKTGFTDAGWNPRYGAQGLCGEIGYRNQNGFVIGLAHRMAPVTDCERWVNDGTSARTPGCLPASGTGNPV